MIIDNAQLPKGYKLTEVGVIPEDWITEVMGNLVESNAPICYGVVQVGSYDNNGVPIVAIKFVKEISHAPLHRTSIDLERPYVRSRVKGGDVLISIKGTIGRVGVVPQGFEGNISRELARIRLKEDFLPTYIAAQLDNAITQERISRAVVGTTRLEFSIATLRQFEIPIPSTKDEQRSLATVLSDTDALIAALDRLIAKKRDLKQATMQQLLTGKTRLPGFGEGKEYKQTDIGVIPEDWKVKSLGSVLSKGRLGGNYPNQDTETDYPLMKMGNIARGYFDVSKVEFIAPGVRPEPDHRLVKRDILFNTRNTLELVGKVAIWLNELPVAYYNSNLMRLEFDPREVCSNEFANYALNTADTIARLRGLATGTTSVAAIYTRDLMGLHIIIPPLPEQRAIAQVLSDMDTEIAALEQRRDKTRALKQGMMQALLTGRIRLG